MIRAKPSRLNLKSGDWVEVKSLQEIRESLDANGTLEGMPFMAEMAEYCGRRFRVFRRAHKTCDTVYGVGGLEVLGGAVHLEEIRCSGSFHGGCQHSCMLFWKDAWLKRVAISADESYVQPPSSAKVQVSELPIEWCYQVGPHGPPEQIRFRCQTTEAPKFTSALPYWRITQYLEDLTSRNINLKEFFAGAIHSFYRSLLKLGFGYRVVVAIHDWIQARRGGIPNPYINGPLTKTPVANLELTVGEWVRIKKFDEIMSTVDYNNKNRGLWFVPQEMGRFCGSTARVAKRIDRVLSEKTGELLTLKTPCVILDNVYCTGRTIEDRVFCPRSSALFWREIWLERIPLDARTQMPN